MIRSLYSGISGMAAHQTKLNVIGNNIANVNTYGFKASRVVFSDVLYQNLSTATEATNLTGGTNASQLGYGAKVASIDMLNTISSGASTGRALDVYIAGEGYLVVQPEAGSNRYTRVGNLKFDASGNLTDGAGSKVMGIPLDADNNPVLDADGTLAIDGLQAINVPPAELEKYTGITIGKSGEITGIKAGDPEFTKATGNAWLTGITLPADSNYTGNVQLAVGEMVNIDAASTEVAALTIEPTADVAGTLTLTKTGDVYTLDPANLTLKDGTTPITGDLTGTLSSSGILTFANLPGLKIDTTKLVSTATDLESGVDIGTIALDGYTSVVATVKNQGGVTEYLRTPQGTDIEFDPTTDSSLVLTSTTGGTVTLNVDPTAFDAIVQDLDTNPIENTQVGKIEAGSDKPVTLGYLAIGKFANVDGLLQDGNGYYMESANSGTPVATKAGTNGTGGTESANLEMSNVDLSQEFTDMIVAQRGFQANSRIITVSDSILEELINLKR
ncbi:flagellar hook-basal body complex protein [Acetobacterium wieringae]|uniref:flagellar hook-basal body complex protein n=1 Tax=Acetobacterium wieringae TaxID=52694 RepID=UPI0026ED24A7|nr:flagellar hook-basal body complex protein [Acetobacterium wieringae]